MASTSIQKSFKYDVFLSFRGEDTRKNFVDHLYHALHHKSIHTYKDDEKITKGKRISDELIQSIEDSRFYIIVFSKNYASSSWCLDELVKIMECQKTGDRTAYPVFYDVEPTEIRNQSGSVGEAFAKHEKQEAAGIWRKALKEAADLAGWELNNTLDGHEAKFIQKIVEEISLELRFIDSSVDGKLIGMESRVKNAVSALETGCDDVRMIGIKGIGGGGKTTLARAVYDHISSWFEGKSFVENVREVSKASLSGLNKLQKQVLSDVLNDQRIKISSVHDGKNMMKKRMRCKRVVVVLDDVDCIDQLEALAGETNWFKPGSRIIITTRDEQVLVAHRVNLILDVNLLSDEEAVCLFSRYVFGKEIPIHGYEELSRQVVRYAAGLPLTIRVLGSFLCGKADDEWKDAIDRLKKIPLRETLEKLELSYIGLEEDYKEIFLDVACIYKGWEKDEAVAALESCGFHARNGLRVLEQKSLITIYENGCLGMHDHIEEMGKNIVRRLHPNEPNRHSRLWIQEEIEDILANDHSGNDAIECIKLDYTSNFHGETCMRGLGKMKKLRVLDIYYRGGLASLCFPNALRYLKWRGYNSKSLLDSFQADKLVGLSMPRSRIMQFWKSGERKVLHKLRFLDMSDSDFLRTFDLGMTPNIEMLNLARSRDLVELNMPLGCSKQLKALNLSSTGLRTLNLAPTPNLEALNLGRCYYLAELRMPCQCPKLKFLGANFSKLKTLDLRLISNLETLGLRYCCNLVELHMPDDCPMLESLTLHGSKLRSLNLASAPNLDELNLSGCHDLVELHIPSRHPKLESLHLHCPKLRTLDFGLTLDLKTLSLYRCNLVEFCMPNECPNLKSFSLEYSPLRYLNLGSTPDLNTLRLKGCHDLLELHVSSRSCPKLKVCILECSQLRTLNLGLSLDLETLVLQECGNLVELHMPKECPNLKTLILVENSNLIKINLGQTPDLEVLRLEGCHDLLEFPLPFRCPKLKSFSLKCSKLRILDFGQTSDIETLSLEDCHELADLHMPNECPKLKYLSLKNSAVRNLNIWSTPDLETFSLEECHDLVHLQMPFGCPKLSVLISYCSKLRTLDFGLTLHLKTLSLHHCCNLVELCMPSECPNLKSFSLKYSPLRYLNLASTPNLDELDLSGCHDLVELHMPSRYPNLKSLYLHCSKLTTLYLGLTSDLETLSLEKCHGLVELHMPDECPNLKTLSLFENSSLRKINLGLTPDLEMLRLEGCHDLSEFRFPFGCPKLKSLSLKCSKLRILNLGQTSDLETLSLEKCHELVELHMPSECPKLKYLSLKNSALKNLNIGSIPDLETLSLEGCHDLVELCMPFRCPKLKVLSLECSKLRTLNHVHTPDLETLILEGGCSNLVELDILNECPKLKSLSINNLKLRSLDLGRTPNLERLNIKKCFNLVELRAPIGCLEKLVYLDLSDCGGFKRFSLIPSPVGSLHLIAKSIDTCSLHFDSNLPKFRFTCLYGEPIHIPFSIGNLGKLISIGLCTCTNLDSFSRSICDLQGLEKLTLEGDIAEVPKYLDRLESLKELSLLSTKIKHLPDSICMLRHVKHLEINSCWFLEKLPEGLGRLECLEDLNITSCIRLQDIPKSICDMRRLKCFNLSSCSQVKKLPRELGRLECLKELNIKDTGISDLSDGIFELQGLHIVASDGLSFTV